MISRRTQIRASLARFANRLVSLEASQILAAVISIASIWYVWQSGNLVAYNDASAHLNTGRRVIDSLTPGFVQLGSVWLPLLHVLLIPFVAVDTLWRTGLAGAIVSGLSFLAASFFMYKLVWLYTGQRFAAFIGALALMLNLNMLYMQTTAMFEPLLMALMIGAVYYLAVWSRTFTAGPLVGAALFTMLGSLTRYDGWAFFLAALAYVVIVSLSRQYKTTVGNAVLFASLAGFGIVLWLLYNQMIFGDALFFQRSEYSAAAQQTVLHERGYLPTKHDVGLSAATYSAAVLLNLGVVVAGAGLAGVLAYFLKNMFKVQNYAPLLLLIPFAFNIVTLWGGQSVIWVPMIAPHLDTFFNARYGLLMLPAAAFFIGYISRWRLVAIFAPAILVAQAAFMVIPNNIPLFGQGYGMVTLRDTVSSVNQQTLNASAYLRDHYQGGLILCSTASSDAFVYRSGIKLSNFITEGTGDYWDESIANPQSHAEWIVMFGNRTDRVGRALTKPDQIRAYHKVYADDTYEIWKLRK